MVRLRYAPSPTGDPHLGNIRTAIWSWLYARKMNGQFIVRIEDTDQAREVPGSQDRILKSLEYLGIDWDEGPIKKGDFGPYIQSQRLDIYKEYSDQLLKSGNAYYAFESPEELKLIREEQKQKGLPPRYDGRGRHLSEEEKNEKLKKGVPCVVRYKMPTEGNTSFEDLIRGEITVPNHTLDDLILIKSDGYPTYHFAHIVDDHLMKITHVTRGDEWIPSTPKHVAIIDGLGWDRPIYVHTPVILGPDGGKLSKRHGARSVLEYQNEGYLPEAIMNYLAMTGWALDDKTNIISVDELMKFFDIKDLLPNPATFDQDKLDWLNGIYIREMNPSKLAEKLHKQLTNDLQDETIDMETVEALTPIVQERISSICDIADLTGFIFVNEFKVAEDHLIEKNLIEKNHQKSKEVLLLLCNHLEQIEESKWTTVEIENVMRNLASEEEVKPGKLFMLTRIIITGQKVSPPLFETMEIVGKNKIIQRLHTVVQKLS